MTNDVADMEREILDLRDDIEMLKDDVNFWRMSFEEEYEVHSDTKERLILLESIVDDAVEILRAPAREAEASAKRLEEAKRKLGLGSSSAPLQPDLVGF